MTRIVKRKKPNAEKRARRERRDFLLALDFAERTILDLLRSARAEPKESRSPEDDATAPVHDAARMLEDISIGFGWKANPGPEDTPDWLDWLESDRLALANWTREDLFKVSVEQRRVMFLELIASAVARAESSLRAHTRKPGRSRATWPESGSRTAGAPSHGHEQRTLIGSCATSARSPRTSRPATATSAIDSGPSSP